MFNKWCNWTGLIICVDKCSTFGIKKNGNSSTQFKLDLNFSICKLGESWVKQNLDSIVNVKRWLHLPQNANMGHLYLPTKHLGLNFSLTSDIYACCQLSTRNILKTSQNLVIQELYQLTKHKFIKEDLIANKTNKDKSSDKLRKRALKKFLEI